MFVRFLFICFPCLTLLWYENLFHAASIYISNFIMFLCDRVIRAGRAPPLFRGQKVVKVVQENAGQR